MKKTRSVVLTPPAGRSGQYAAIYFDEAGITATLRPPGARPKLPRLNPARRFVRPIEAQTGADPKS
jgi:hypothetical protein